MTFSSRVLLEIVDIVRKGILEGKDISQSLREMEVEVDPENKEKIELASVVNLKTGGY